MRFTDLQSYSFEHRQRLTRYCPPLFTGDRQDSNPTCRHFHATRCSSTQPVHNLVVKCSTVFFITWIQSAWWGPRKQEPPRPQQLFFGLSISILQTVIGDHNCLPILVSLNHFQQIYFLQKFLKDFIWTGAQNTKKVKKLSYTFFHFMEINFFLSFRPFTWPRSEDPLKKPQMASKLQNHTA